MTRIRDALSLPIDVSPTISVYCHPSLGSADARDTRFDRVALLNRADVAMYKAKQQHRHSVLPDFGDGRRLQRLDHADQPI